MEHSTSQTSFQNAFFDVTKMETGTSLSDMSIQGTGIELEHKLVHDLQLLASFVQNNTVSLIFVKSENNNKKNPK